MQYIDKIGVELEGGWDKPPRGWLHFVENSEFTVKEDCSIEFPSNKTYNTGKGKIKKEEDLRSLRYAEFPGDSDSYCEYALEELDSLGSLRIVAAEFNSPPYEEVELLSKWIRKYYPHYVNRTCGFHVHVSLKNETFAALLANNKFNTYFKYRMKKWGKENLNGRHEFWRRYFRKRIYCSIRFNAENQLMGRSGERYNQLNFESFRNRKTIENRLFPMFENSELAISALLEYIDCVESFIDSHKDKFFSKRKEFVARICV